MTCTSEIETVLKCDALGRVIGSERRREELLDEFEKSGLSGNQFAQLTGIKYPTFMGWVQKRRRARLRESMAEGLEGSEQSACVADGPVRLFETVTEIEQIRSGVGLRIELPGGAVLMVESPRQVAMAAELLVLLSKNGRGGC